MQALVIDDSRAMRRIVCGILADFGFTRDAFADKLALLGLVPTGARS